MAEAQLTSEQLLEQVKYWHGRVGQLEADMTALKSRLGQAAIDEADRIEKELSEAKKGEEFALARYKASNGNKAPELPHYMAVDLKVDINVSANIKERPKPKTKKNNKKSSGASSS